MTSRSRAGSGGRFVARLLVVCGLACACPFRASAQQDLVTQARRLDLRGDQVAAIALYERALEQDANSFDAHYGIARALDLAGRYDDARRHFARAIELAPEGLEDQARRMLGVSYVFTGDVEEAARRFRQVFDRRVGAGNIADAAEVANELGRVYLENGDLDDASRWYQTGYDTALGQPGQSASAIDLADLRWAHAQARIAARRNDAMEAHRQEAVVKKLLDKGTNPDQRIQEPYLRGYVAFHLGRFRDAVANLQKGDQSDPFILVMLAEAFGKLGNDTRAGELYAKALTSTAHSVNNAFARRIASRPR